MKCIVKIQRIIFEIFMQVWNAFMKIGMVHNAFFKIINSKLCTLFCIFEGFFFRNLFYQLSLNLFTQSISHLPPFEHSFLENSSWYLSI